jgi:organic radical activating enzyme
VDMMSNKINLDLEYIEFSIADHCNLSCKGCALFSPLAKPNFISLEQHRYDMYRLSHIFNNIKLIRILGGEPLLNPKIHKIINITRSTFPEAKIHILTNGTLLEQMGHSFWDCLKTNKIQIDLTLYPIFFEKESKYQKLANLKNIKLCVRKKYHFKKFLNIEGMGNEEEIFKKCSFKVSTFLRNGKISSCHLPSLSYVYNDYFGTNISNEGTINIHNKNISALQIIKFLKKPKKACKFCAEYPKKIFV